MLIIKLLLLVPTIILGLSELEINLSTVYFKYKNLKSVCLVFCNDSKLTLKFSKQLFEESVFLSSMKMLLVDSDDVLDSSKVMGCWRQHSVPIGIVIDAQCVQFQQIMELASQELVLGDTHQWLIIKSTDEFNEINEDTILDGKVGDVKLNDSNRNIDETETIDEDDNYVNDTLVKQSNDADATLITSNNNTIANDMNSNIFKVLDEINLGVNSDIVVAVQNSTNEYELYDVYNFGKIQGGEMNVNTIGSWSKEKGGLKISQTAQKYERRWDFKQLPVRMIIVYNGDPEHFKPENLGDRTYTTSVNVVTKISYAAFVLLADAHNFRFIYTTTDRWIGTFDKNGTRNVASSIYFREQDVSPLLRVVPEFLDKMQFIQPPLADIETKFYYKIPTTGVGKIENQFLTPLTSQVWLCVISSAILCGLVLLMAASIERRPSSPQYALFTVLASICQQYFEENAEATILRFSSARKLSVLVTGISFVLVYNYYTSSVVSWLLNGPPPSINSLEELVNSPLQIVLEDVGYSWSWLQVPGYYFNKRHAKVEDEMRRKKIKTKKEGDPLLLSLDDGIELVKEGGYAFHCQVVNAGFRLSKSFNKMELCELGSLKSMSPTKVFPAIQKQSPFKEFFTLGLTSLNERGHLSIIQRRFAAPDITCAGTLPRPLSLGGAAPAFILLAFGYFVAVLFLVGEIFVYRKKKLEVKCLEALI